MVSKTRGRPKGQPNTKARILEIAFRRLSESEYDDLTLRSIADEAGVDPASVVYHFGSKQNLFLTALVLKFDVGQMIRDVFSGDEDTLAERIVRATVAHWEAPETSNPTAQLMSMALNNPDLLQGLQEYYSEQVSAELKRALPGNRSDIRSVTVMTVVNGMISSRYLFQLDESAEMPVEDFIQLMIPIVKTALNA